MLIISDDRAGLLRLLARVVSGVSGVLVAGGWCYQLLGFVWGARRRRRGKRDGVLHGRTVEGHDDDED